VVWASVAAHGRAGRDQTGALAGGLLVMQLILVDRSPA